ncbi:MAG: hypothetical protein KAG89_03975 [Fulvimarina manganoxydans]|uniref:hypothetical protein n=1 Tax=Fulvimarina manganoxydans TaxID=937218 RepID=UPI0023556DA6|nr:hypothetical protein [Fulvimarina manganoxydans]MCK5931309.1 hypothetical protein [Fulvimarina manganoxydans]
MFGLLTKPRYGDESLAHSSALVSYLRSWSTERRRQRLQRDAFNSLLKLDDDILWDVVGVRREDVVRLANLPIGVDAMAALKENTAERRA